MQVKSFELKGFSAQAIESLNSILSNEEDYNMISEMVQISPATIQNTSTDLNIRIYSCEDLEKLKIKLAKIYEQPGELPYRRTQKRQNAGLKMRSFRRSRKIYASIILRMQFIKERRISLDNIKTRKIVNMKSLTNKEIASKVIRYVFLILCCFYIGYSMGKDAAERDNRIKAKVLNHHFGR